MARPDPKAGGFLLSASIVLGLFAGILLGSPIYGAVIGTIAGIFVALLVWALDRGRARR
jgi:hypothetical protein